MGFAEIQAAFAANGAAPTPIQPTPAQAPAFTPSFPPGGAPAFPAPSFVPAPAPAQPLQGSFAFTPPAGFQPNSAPPINPPGERAALTAPEPAPVAVQPPADPDPTPAKAKRGRKPKADLGKAAAVALMGGDPDAAVADESTDLTADAAQVAALPHDGTSVERIVQELFARGVSSVHLTFTKEGT